MIYVIYALCGLGLLQCVALTVLLRRRRDLDIARFETRLSHFAEALALLTDTTQSGFASVAAELERVAPRKTPAVSRAATSRRIVTAARKGRSIQDIAAAEELSESEIRLTLDLAEERTAASPAPGPAAVTPAAPAGPRAPRPSRATRRSRPATETLAVQPAAEVAAVVHDAPSKGRATRRAGHTLNVGA